jgi:hypothetical protein
MKTLKYKGRKIEIKRVDVWLVNEGYKSLGASAASEDRAIALAMAAIDAEESK